MTDNEIVEIRKRNGTSYRTFGGILNNYVILEYDGKNIKQNEPCLKVYKIIKSNKRYFKAKQVPLQVAADDISSRLELGHTCCADIGNLQLDQNITSKLTDTPNNVLGADQGEHHSPYSTLYNHEVRMDNLTATQGTKKVPKSLQSQH